MPELRSASCSSSVEMPSAAVTVPALSPVHWNGVLTPRQQLILRKVVDEFSATGQPVGSKALAADPEISAGPSTIRNELAVLEENGLLAHPHTSAGRVPTDAGYRYFVDELLPAQPAGAKPELGLQL